MNARETTLTAIQTARRVLHFVIILLFLSMFIVVTLNVIMRFVFNNPIAFSGELARYLFVSITYLGSILAFKENAHIGLDIFIENLPDRIKLVIHIVDRFLVAIFLIVFSIAGFKMAFISIDTKSSAMFISMAIPYIVLPISSVAMLLELLITASGIENPKQETT